MASLSRVGTRLMRCGACPRAALVGYKTTTGIVGIEADPDAVQNLSQLLKKMLRVRGASHRHRTRGIRFPFPFLFALTFCLR
mmetsp:Transcript_15896/g.40543  ORF Transcript_15896/g.40543 Transcript_15896/m.40543 type:complete len:82 (-) Transcript_15896:464-709(-)